MLQIAKTLISYNICIDNQYLQKYTKLVQSKLTTPRLPGKTYAHHVIPVIYYQKLNNLPIGISGRPDGNKLAEQDSNNFVVNLTATEHILAHCYLALSSNQCWFTFANMKALQLLTHGENDPEVLLKQYEKLGKFTNKTSYRCWVHKAAYYKNILTVDLDKYLAAGWQYGAAGRSRAKATTVLLKENNYEKGSQIWMHNDFENTKVAESNILAFLQKGYQVGRANLKHPRKTITLYKNNVKFKVHINNLMEYLIEGYTITKK